MILHTGVQICLIRQRARAFTLLELLVSLAIVAVLALLAMTSTRSLRRSADQATCISNLRQIGIGMLAYAGENGGLLPGPMTGGQRPFISGNNQVLANRNSLIDYIWPYIDIPMLNTGETFYSKIFTCSAGAKAIAAAGGEARKANYFVHLATYIDAATNLRPFGYKSSGSTTLFPFRLSNIPYPARVLALVDEDNDLLDGATLSPAKPVHEVVRNVLFIDGHVGSIPLASFVVQGIYLEVKQ